MGRGPLDHQSLDDGQVAAEQQQTHTALRQRRLQQLGRKDVAAHGVAVDQPLDAVEVWQGSGRSVAAPLQERGLQLGKTIKRPSHHNLPGPVGEGGGARDGER